MSLCSSCGVQLSEDGELCPHHHYVYADDWALNNRIMCNFFHRGVVPDRLTAKERNDDFWSYTNDAA